MGKHIGSVMTAQELKKIFEIKRKEQGPIMKCRKKPLEVEAFKWNGNLKELIKWANTTPLRGSYTFEHKKGFFGKDVLLIKTNKGKMDAKLGDYIIKGIKNEFYPVKPDIFRDTYEIL